MSNLLRTPLLRSTTLGATFGGTALLKAELLQKTGSFKPRGILAKLATLSVEEKGRGVITVSAGNAAAAVAYGCSLESIDCLVVMWQGTSDLKAEAARGYGAAVDREAPDPTEAFGRLEALRADSGRVFVHPYDDPAVIEGHSSLSREIVEEAPETEVIVVPVGGGGLVSGVAVGAPGVRVVGVEPEGSRALHEGLAAGSPVPVRPDSIADALNAPVVGEHCLAVCKELGVESALVTDDDVRAGFRFLYERAKLAAEPGAAAGVGALLAGKVPEVEGKTVAIVVSGGNVAPKTAAAILSGNEA
ncbi:MAG TPA: pyridoxal-phosphate dependent enzyme [Gaiellaceae bacterium]|nr:pyridoxal-phosphate dependent enzyme [Gaiellaceae bacterium]